MAVGLALVSLAIFINSKQLPVPTATLALVFLLVAFLVPDLLKYFYIFWMKLAYSLSWVNTRILLGIIFYLVFTPVGLFRRLFKVDLLETKFKPHLGSYWKSKTNPKAAPTDYHRQS